MTSTAKKLEAAREEVNRHQFGTPEWEAAMVIVRKLADKLSAARPQEEFCSIDSGIHRTRLLDGRVF